MMNDALQEREEEEEEASLRVPWRYPHLSHVTKSHVNILQLYTTIALLQHARDTLTPRAMQAFEDSNHVDTDLT